MTDLAAPPARGSNSIIASIVDKLVALCAVIPYALIALGLRFVMARIFFLSGQAKIEGPVIPVNLNIGGLEFSVVLPAQIKDSTFQMFETQYANLPIAPMMAAYLFSYAEFVLPVCLVLGFATRFAALGLLVMTRADASLCAAGDVVADPRLLGRDPAGADVGRSRRDLDRRADPVRLLQGQAGRIARMMG